MHKTSTKRKKKIIKFECLVTYWLIWVNISLIAYIFLSIISLVAEIRERMVSKKWFSDFNEIHKTHSSTWDKLYSHRTPHLLDFIMDASYVLAAVRSKKYRFYLYFIIIFLFFLFFNILPLLYAAFYFISVIAFCIYLLYGICFKKKLSINGDSFLVKPRTLHHTLLFFFLAPPRWAFITLYAIINSKKKKKIPNFDLSYIISIVLFKSPFWFVSNCIYWGICLTDNLCSVHWERKTTKGRIRELIHCFYLTYLSIGFNNYILAATLLSGRKITVSQFITINGGSLLRLLNETEAMREIYFTVPAQVELKGTKHQAWRKSFNSNQFIIMTSSETLQIGNITYKCYKLDYSSQTPQYFVLTYIDLKNTNWNHTSNFTVLGKQGLFDHGNLYGQVLKFNCFYKLFKGIQVLHQNKSQRLITEIKNPIPLNLLYKLNHSNNLDYIQELAALESRKFLKYDTSLFESNLNKMVLLSNAEIFEIARYSKEFKNFDEKIREIYLTIHKDEI